MILQQLKNGIKRVIFYIWRFLGFNPQVPTQSSALLKKMYYAVLKIAPGLAQRIREIAFFETVAHSYLAWIKANDTFTSADLLAIKNQVTALDYQPLISVIISVHNPPINFLKTAIESVIAQIYSPWELALIEDASINAAVKTVLNYYTSNYPNIKVIAATALPSIQGAYVMELGAEDILPPQALALLVQSLNDHQQAKILYSDEDQITLNGQRKNHGFKPDWNYAFLLSQNYIGHAVIYQRQLIDSIAGFGPAFSGLQDYALLLRGIEKIKSNEILHIPYVLYHKRESKKTNAAPGFKLVQEHLHRQGIHAIAEPAPELPHYTRVRYALPKELPLVSIIIPTRNRLDLLQQCITSIIDKTTYKNYEIIIIDNNSDEPACLAYLLEQQQKGIAKVLRDRRPFNYSALNNAAIPYAQGELVAFVNNDIQFIAPDWLHEMVSQVLQPQIGIVGAKLFYPDNTIQHAGVILGLSGIAGHCYVHLSGSTPGYMHRAKLTQNLTAVTAACFLMRKALFLQAGGFNEESLAVNFNDVDLCIKVHQLGYQNLWTPYATAYHYESASRGRDNTPEKIERFAKECHYMQQHWQVLLMNDPHYNPNLSLTRADFALAAVSRVKKFWQA